MVYVEATMCAPYPAQEAYARVTDWERHRVPLTQIRRLDDGFLARTGVGPVAFDDRMRVIRHDAPHSIELLKEGTTV